MLPILLDKSSWAVSFSTVCKLTGCFNASLCRCQAHATRCLLDGIPSVRNCILAAANPAFCLHSVGIIKGSQAPRVAPVKDAPASLNGHHLTKSPSLRGMWGKSEDISRSWFGMTQKVWLRSLELIAQSTSTNIMYRESPPAASSGESGLIDVWARAALYADRVSRAELQRVSRNTRRRYLYTCCPIAADPDDSRPFVGTQGRCGPLCLSEGCSQLALCSVQLRRHAQRACDWCKGCLQSLPLPILLWASGCGYASGRGSLRFVAIVGSTRTLPRAASKMCSKMSASLYGASNHHSLLHS